MVRGWLVTFGRQCPETGSGTFLDGDRLCLSQNGKVTHLLDSSDILLRGEHNRLNVLAACAIAFAAGLPVEAMQAGVAGFRGVAHRLEFVATVNGADWYNDSIATAPERTLAAIQSFSEPLVLLLGGRDKKLPWDMLAEAVSRRVDHVVLFGEAAGMIEAVLHRHAAERPYSIQRVAGLEQAVQAAAQVAQPGNVVLLSPGGTSYDEFIDFEQRGERYRQWVQQLS
jgi:UDP-N-acetylmuramoylalanine--D-glutamate ligase